MTTATRALATAEPHTATRTPTPDELRHMAATIRTDIVRGQHGLADAGEKLLLVKATLKRGEFSGFLTACGISRSQAGRYMQAAALRQKFPALGNVPLEAEAVTLLAQKSTPPEIIAAVIAGQVQPTRQAVRQALDERQSLLQRIKTALTAPVRAESPRASPKQRGFVTALREVFDVLDRLSETSPWESDTQAAAALHAVLDAEDLSDMRGALTYYSDAFRAMANHLGAFQRGAVAAS